jgi:hypothetical protein
VPDVDFRKPLASGERGGVSGVTYRTISPPSGWRSWTAATQWVRWVNQESLCPSVAPRHPESCTLCYGATGYRFDGVPWNRCPQCEGYGSVIDAAVPIAYGVSDGLESLLYQFKGFGDHYGCMAAPLASVSVTFLVRHFQCIQDRYGEVEILTVVPSGNPARNRNHLGGPARPPGSRRHADHYPEQQAD